MELKKYVNGLYGKGIMLGRVTQEYVVSGRVFNPMQSEYRSNPYPYLNELRTKSPLHRSFLINGWILTRYEDVFDVLSSDKFGSDQRKLNRWPEMEAQLTAAGVSSPYETGASTLLGEDPPDHLRTRRFAAKAFTPQSLKLMKPQIEAMLEEVASGLPRCGTFEFVSNFSEPFPIAVIASILGVPKSDWKKFNKLSVDLIKMLSPSDKVDLAAAGKARVELYQYFLNMVEDRRSNPRNDVVSTLVESQREDGSITDKELISIVIQFLVAGNVTTTRLISSAVLALLRNPSQIQLLRDRPDLLENAVEEFLRYDPPAPFISRVVLEDQEFKGRKFLKGQMVLLSIAAANRDPIYFENPDRLDVSRNNNRHLSFAHGAHFCLGARLARLEAFFSLKALIELLPDISLSNKTVEWGNSIILYGPEVLWLNRKK